MATSLVIEEERGTCTGSVHAHNGYYAGSFTTLPDAVPTQPPTRLVDLWAAA
jgi:hypothetical protein